MPRYHYIARDVDGNKVEGLTDAASNLMVITNLRNQNLFPVEVQSAGQKKTQSDTRNGAPRSMKGKIGLKELAVFTRQTSAMLDAGVSIVEILQDLASQTSNPYFAAVLRGIRKEIQEGSNFSSSLARYPRIYSRLYVALVRSGE